MGQDIIIRKHIRKRFNRRILTPNDFSAEINEGTTKTELHIEVINILKRYSANKLEAGNLFRCN